MEIRFFLNFVVILALSSSVSCFNEIRMIADVVKSYNRPTAVVAVVCWKLKYKLELTTLLKSVGDLKMTRFIHENTESFDFPHRDAIIVADASCSLTRHVLSKTNNKKMFTNFSRWLIFGILPNENSMIVPDYLNDLNILTDSEVMISHSFGDGTFYQLYLIYKNNPKSQWVTEEFGAWTPTYGLRMFKLMNTVLRRKNLSKESVRISFVITDNRTKHELYDVRNQVDSLTKISYRQSEPLFDFINASMVTVFTETWGYLLNGSWNGMAGNIVRGEADIAGTVHFPTKSRAEVLHFLSSPIPVKVAFVFREPPLSYQNNLFLLPFKASVWWCTAGFVLILMFFLFANAQWEARNSNNMKTSHSALQPKVSDVVMMVISAISQQGSSTELKGVIGRFVMFLLFIALLILYMCYSANVVALLQSSSKQIRTLADLLDSKLELGVEDQPYNRYYFTTATDPVRKAIYETKVAPRGSKPKFMSLDEGVRKLQKSPFAFNMNTGPGYRVVERYFYEHEKCGLQEITYTPSNKPWLSCNKDSPHKNIFKVGLCRIIEHGLSDRHYRQMYSRKPGCSSHGGTFASVSIIDVYPAMLMLLYGMGVALALLGVELAVHRKCMRRQRDVEESLEL